MIGTNVETGCYIDGSHMSSFSFTTAVINLAIDHGFQLDYAQFEEDVEWFTNNFGEDEDREYEILDALDFTYYEAIDYLNDNTREGLYWEVMDQSLYLTEDDDE